MTDATYVFAPGERITDDSTGAPICGATIEFYDAQTLTPKTVYADSALSAVLGTTVQTDALGYPVTSSNGRTLIYVGSAPYKLVIKDGSGVPIATHDNIPGATVSAPANDVAVTATFPVVTKSLDYTVVQADQNTTFVVNCSSSDVNITLPSAVPSNDPTKTGQVSANGWKIKVQHAGSANRVIIKTVSPQNISGGVASTSTQMVLVRQGEDVEMTADGGNWRASSHTQASPHNYATGVIQIVSRLAASPGSPAPGDKYILTGIGGSWSSFATGDIATWNGAQWLNQTPPSNSGWVAYVQGESQYYTYQSSAWVGGATSSNVGMLKVATQSVQETATANDTAVTPGTQKFHPGHPKAWGVYQGSGTPALQDTWGISGAVRNGIGDYTISLSTPMTTGTYCVVAMGSSGSGTGLFPYMIARTTGSFRLGVSDNDVSQNLDSTIYFAVFGDT